MEAKFNHSVLIVDDEEPVCRAVARLLRRMEVECVHVSSGEEALEMIRKASRPFSLIITDQRMPGMKGSELLEKARELTPDTIRFLMTGFSDVRIIIDAVNKGAVNRYIPKPWDNKVFMELIRNSLDRYERILETERLFGLAKEQNVKLYMLNCDLKEKADECQKAISELDREIFRLTEEVAAAERAGGTAGEGSELDLAGKLVSHGLTDQKSLEDFYARAMGELQRQFQEIAGENGFEVF